MATVNLCSRSKEKLSCSKFLRRSDFDLVVNCGGSATQGLAKDLVGGRPGSRVVSALVNECSTSGIQVYWINMPLRQVISRHWCALPQPFTSRLPYVRAFVRGTDYCVIIWEESFPNSTTYNLYVNKYVLDCSWAAVLARISANCCTHQDKWVA